MPPKIKIKYTTIQDKILDWYNTNKENYPWRTSQNPFQILITEILLQKTIASNVSNLFQKFFEKYSEFSKIYESKIEEIQGDIKSLGLSNKRAKILKDLSELIVKEYNGEIPEDPKALQKVNGIADYVSNAYLCFGLNKRTFFYDVNIKRFVSRIFEGTDAKISVELIENTLDKILPKQEPKHFYWAILDFGNKICKKSKPKCNKCPISDLCAYYCSKK